MPGDCDCGEFCLGFNNASLCAECSASTWLRFTPLERMIKCSGLKLHSVHAQEKSITISPISSVFA